jgi:hypothetical protein
MVLLTSVKAIEPVRNSAQYGTATNGEASMPVTKDFVEQRRREKRIPCDPSRVRITAEGSLATVGGYVVDVSRSGLKLRTDEYLRIGAEVAVEMDGLLIRGTIRYRYAQKTKSAAAFEIGIKTDALAQSRG